MKNATFADTPRRRAFREAQESAVKRDVTVERYITARRMKLPEHRARQLAGLPR